MDVTDDIGELLDSAEVAAMLKVKKPTLRGMVERGDIPAPIRINARVIRWSRNAIDECLRAKLAGG